VGLPSGLFPSCFPTKFQYASLLSPILATCPTNHIRSYASTPTICFHGVCIIFTSLRFLFLCRTFLLCV
jgi:hypothetical protein